MTTEAERMTTTEQKVTRSEVFAGIACFLSASTLAFNMGFVWSQTQQNTADIKELQIKMDAAIPDIAGMKSDIKFLVEAERQRQARMAR